jgi:hypothetical protein
VIVGAINRVGEVVLAERDEDAAREPHRDSFLIGLLVVVCSIGRQPIDEHLAVGITDHHGRNAHAA